MNFGSNCRFSSHHVRSENTLQRLREALWGDQDYKFLLCDRHKTFSATLEETAESWGVNCDHPFECPPLMLIANG
jgi:hypothetical protein